MADFRASDPKRVWKAGESLPNTMFGVWGRAGGRSITAPSTLISPTQIGWRREQFGYQEHWAPVYRGTQEEAPIFISVTAAPATVPPGGQSKIAAQITNRGRPVSGFATEFSLRGKGRFGAGGKRAAAKTNAKGVAVATYTAGMSPGVTDTITASFGGRTGETTVTVIDDGDGSRQQLVFLFWVRATPAEVDTGESVEVWLRIGISVPGTRGGGRGSFAPLKDEPVTFASSFGQLQSRDTPEITTKFSGVPSQGFTEGGMVLRTNQKGEIYLLFSAKGVGIEGISRLRANMRPMLRDSGERTIECAIVGVPIEPPVVPPEIHPEPEVLIIEGGGTGFDLDREVRLDPVISGFEVQELEPEPKPEPVVGSSLMSAPISGNMGMHTKNSKVMVPVQKVRLAQNCTFREDNAFVKRNGHTKINNSVPVN